MPLRALSLSRRSRLRRRVAVLAAGAGVSALLGSGVATAADSAATGAGAWVGPVRQYGLTAGFGRAGGMWRAGHSGQDFAVPSGTRVVAVHTGTVVKAGGNGAGDGSAYGNAVVLRHADGTYSQYAHLSRIDVRPGQSVTTGQRIGLSGSTGNSSGPHLHFEIRRTPHYGSAVNPLAFLRAKGVAI
ncbi:M23 family metallopeptidase [Streptomyces gibsoniae]|uniref:M23 family metallopeptidase n=1 Tax=Streptomyces gibsoniae TaxID=3075529 RepID=A0ABU2TSJ3_9ACTN|nr:M23 family metallopeptidase [Streptomyces sp. DSM 41699]MDT0463827.1 M23 family metallopeptidase [Streptomyces sp. DSM 41699]